MSQPVLWVFYHSHAINTSIYLTTSLNSLPRRSGLNRLYIKKFVGLCMYVTTLCILSIELINKV